VQADLTSCCSTNSADLIDVDDIFLEAVIDFAIVEVPWNDETISDHLQYMKNDILIYRSTPLYVTIK
jgi:hypothetical protein